MTTSDPIEDDTNELSNEDFQTIVQLLLFQEKDEPKTTSDLTTHKDVQLISNYYKELNEISNDGYVTLEVVALIIDMLHILGEPTREQLMQIFGNEEQVNTLCSIYDILADEEGKAHISAPAYLS